MPVFNCERYVSQSIESILNQTLGDFEFLIINDGSTDGSLKIIEQYAKSDSRIRILTKLNGGIVSALNMGLDNASGEMIARMDSDDLCHPGRFEAQFDYLKEHPEVCLLGTASEYVDPVGRRLKAFYPPENHDDIIARLLVGDGAAMIHPTLMGPVSTWRNAGGYRKEYNFVEDYDFYIRASRLGKLANLKIPFLLNRLHFRSTNHTLANEQHRLTNILCCKYRLESGLTETFTVQSRSNYQTKVDFHRQWALWAVEGNELNTALRHAFWAMTKGPISTKNRNCFFYVLKQWFHRKPV